MTMVFAYQMILNVTNIMIAVMALMKPIVSLLVSILPE